MNKTIVSLDTFKDCFLPNNYNENMFNEDGSINNKYYSFKKTGIISQIFEDHWNYVYAEKKKFDNLKDSIEYITRYCGRAPINENRIINYDGNNVTFRYNDHKDESYHEITCPTKEFIIMLLRHLLPLNYKIIRYYRFYRKKSNVHDKIKLLVDKIKVKFRRSLLKLETSILKNFNKNPFKCKHCDKKLKCLATIT